MEENINAKKNEEDEKEEEELDELEVSSHGREWKESETHF